MPVTQGYALGWYGAGLWPSTSSPTAHIGEHSGFCIGSCGAAGGPGQTATPMGELLQQRKGFGGEGGYADFEGGGGQGFELAGVGAGEWDAGLLCGGEFCGVHGAEPEEGYGDLLGGWLAGYGGLEAEAEDAYVF